MSENNTFGVHTLNESRSYSEKVHLSVQSGPQDQKTVIFSHSVISLNQ